MKIEKVIKQLESIADHTRSMAASPDADEIWKEDSDALEFAITALRSMQETTKPGWISVKERLPEAYYGESDNVLVVDEIGIRKILYFDGGCWCYPTGETYDCKVTHWMPLPEPPEEG